MPDALTVTVVGATGYIGGRLVPELLEAGHHVRCLARTPSRLRDRPWIDQVEVFPGDVFEPDTLRPAFDGADAVVYLVHSMDGTADFASRDREAARNVRTVAADTGVRQLVYLGGLGDEDDDLSEHLRSRHEVGRELAAGPVPVTELRAAVIIGSGSASFEMLRNLTEVLPVMTTPRWVQTRCQPIAVRDVLAHLVGVLGNDAAMGRVLEIGGPDVLTYEQMMQLYAEVAGLRRRVVIPVPLLSPGLSSLWIGLVTPLPVGLARPLVDSLVNEVVVTDPGAREVVPHDPLPIRDAIQLALRRIQDLDVTTTWASAAGVGAGAPATPAGTHAEEPVATDPDWAGGTVLSHGHETMADVPADLLVATAERWGRSRGWQVEPVDDPTRLRLRLPTRLPGQAWLDVHAEPAGTGSRLVLHDRFAPRGLAGRAAWYALLPRQGLRLGRTARAITAAAARRHGRAVTSEQDARRA